MRRTLVAGLASVALVAASLMGAGAATAAPSATAVTPTLGLTNGTYHVWCNWNGFFCSKARRYNGAGGYWYWDICSNVWCTQFNNFYAHPPVSKAKAR